MARKADEPLRCVRLDNAAKIYPAERRKNWRNVFGQSVTLSDDVDTGVLKPALDVVVNRFPSIAACLRKGVFWYYLQQVEAPSDIKEEYSCRDVVSQRKVSPEELDGGKRCGRGYSCGPTGYERVSLDGLPD